MLTRVLTLTFALMLSATTAYAAVTPSYAAASAPTSPDPVLVGDFADPTVARHRDGLVAFSTGSLIPRASSATAGARWQRTGRGLVKLPSWSHNDGDIWASDVARVGRWWLLYFAAPVRGIGEYGRCIGVARSRNPQAGFRPVGNAPLVCPSYAKAPAAGDPVTQPDRSLPRAGVIDPSVFVEGKQVWLLYKTDRIPSSIRIVSLSRNGTRAKGPSAELFRHDGVLENPVVVRRSGGYVMLLSQGDFGRCSYRTVWRRSESLLDWSLATTGILLDRETSGLCGPGGGDLAEVPNSSRTRLFLHAWTCRARACPTGTDLVKKRRRLGSTRPMFAVDIDWRGGVPTLGRWR